ncbi:MAG TPA: hypothetical protein VGJ55_01270, partial [Pyrinomonadaceae bacterium]
MIKIATFLFGLAIMFAPAAPVKAQDSPTQQPATDEEKQKEKAANEKRAFTLLEQVVAEGAGLKLPENRIRMQITAADLLWDRNEVRARALFLQAADGVAEMIRTVENKDTDQRQNFQMRTPDQLRQDLVLAVARHNAPLAYQVLASTRSLTPPPADNSFGQRPNPEEALEQILLARIASTDPKLALQNAEQLMDKGQYPRTLTSVLGQLQQKDKEAATKLEDKIVQRLESENMLANIDAGNLAIGLLSGGPRVASPSTDPSTPAPAATPSPQRNAGRVLSESSYQDLMRTLIETALKATPAPAGNQRGGNAGRGRGPNAVRQANAQTTLSDAEIEQNNARRLLSGVQSLLPKIDQYMPDRAQLVRSKIAEVGMGNNNQRNAVGQAMNALQQGNADSLMAAAPSAPAQLQPRIYQQAA